MKATNCSVVFLLFLGLPAFSQTAPQSPQLSNSIAAARCQYLGTGLRCVQPSSTGVIAQFPRGRGSHQRIGAPPGVGYLGGHPSRFMGSGSRRHAVIGALIGFGLGAALGAKANTDQHSGADVKAAFVVGGIGALIGVAVGSSMPSFQSRNPRSRGPWPGEDDEASLHRGRKRPDLAVDRRISPKKGVAATVSVSPFQEPESTRHASEY